MRKTTQLRLVLAAVVVIGAACLLWPREPTYGGKRLSAWLRDFEAEQSDRRAAAADAVRHIGSNAVPLLVEQLRRPLRPEGKTSRMERWKQAFITYLRSHTSIHVVDRRIRRPRMTAFAALDALGPVGKDALPALEELLHESPPDPDVLYVVARMGEAGKPVLWQAVTNQEKLIRWEAAICLKMAESWSEGRSVPDAASDLNSRLCEFHLKIMQASFQEYRRLHPEPVVTETDTSSIAPAILSKREQNGETNAVRRAVPVNPFE